MSSSTTAGGEIVSVLASAVTHRTTYARVMIALVPRRGLRLASTTDKEAAAHLPHIRHSNSMRVRINGGGQDEAARIARALAAGGFVISASDDPCDLVLTVGEGMPARIQLGDHVVDFARRRILCGGQPIWLTPAEFGLLEYLHRAGRPVSRGELLRELWGLRFDPQTNSVAVHVSRLRRKLGPASILTEANGYRIGTASAPI